MKHFDVIVIGGGQSALAVGYYLRRSGLSFTILDANDHPGGSWQHFWKSLRLFSPAQWSSLPGIIMPGGQDYYPTRDETIEYLRLYEKKYQLPVQRPVHVKDVRKVDDVFVLDTSQGTFETSAVINATGIFMQPVIPQMPELKDFKGRIIHSSEYVSPEAFIGQRVAIVGEGNSGAQILAEVSKVASTVWVTLKEPSFLPDHIDGRFLFDAASQMYEAKKQGKDYQPPSLGQVVMVPPVVEARERGVFNKTYRGFKEIDLNGLDAIIFCTGFKPALKHLGSLNVVNADGKANTVETRSTAMEGLWFVGYGNWTGFASATLIGVGRSARSTVDQVVKYLTSQKDSRSRLAD